MIRQAIYSDIDKIMQFIDTFWKKGHILAVDREFFEYQYYVNGEVNFIISEDDNCNIEAIMGFIRYSKSKINGDVINALWKVKPKVAKPMLGLQLLEHILKNKDNRLVASPGINPNTIPIYRYFKYYTDKMMHYYRLNSECKDFRISKIYDNQILDFDSKIQKNLKQIKNVSDLHKYFSFEKYEKQKPKPFKEMWYIERRYFNHPYYQYRVYGIETDSFQKCDTIIVLRKVIENGSACLRLVDIIGDFSQLKNSTQGLDIIMKKENCEYIDIYCAGLESSLFYEAGYINRYETNNIIPNYFEPYLQQNIDIWYFTNDTEVILFKGDGDQDRPNTVGKSDYNIWKE